MNNLLFTVLIIGLSGLVAQALLLRELLVSFLGNELTFGIILANWIILEAAGVFIVGKLVDRARNKINVFIALQLIFSLSFPFAVYLARAFKSLSGIPFGEALGLPAIFYSSLAVILPISFTHGALFSTACKIHSLESGTPGKSIGKIYSWETTGTIIGGVVFTYIFLPYLNSLQIAFLVSSINIFICLFYLSKAGKSFKYFTVFTLAAVCLFVMRGGSRLIQDASLKEQWVNQELLDSRNSIYGNVSLVRSEGQLTFFYNGLPVITTPNADKQFVEDFGQLPLLFCEKPENVLVISSGAGGLISEILKHPVGKVDYVEIDPLIIGMLKDYPTALTERELKDKRVNIINTDGRVFLNKISGKYDVILIGLSNQSALSTNRLFTEEFFLLAAKKLSSRGILGLWLPGSLTYLSRELIDLNYSVLNGLRRVFAFVRVIPGDYNIVLASPDENITRITPGLLSARIEERGIKVSLLKPAYLDYRLGEYWPNWFKEQSAFATKDVNRDFRPIAVFESLVFWNKKFSPGIEPVLKSLSKINLKRVFLLAACVTAALAYVARRFKKKGLTVIYAIATTGFFAMLSNLVLIFSFQVFYGYLYHRIGLLISIFMAGIATGSIFINSRIDKKIHRLSSLILLESAMVLFIGLTALILGCLNFFGGYSGVVFIALFYVCGLFAGLEFPLAATIYLKDEARIGGVSGALYCADLFGGWFAGIAGGVVLLPVMGILNTCLVMIIFKISSIILLFASKKGVSFKN